MILKPLFNSGRNREFDSYSFSEKAQVVYAFLFEGREHREIDRTILKLDDEKTRGFQSMNILHYLGLKKPNKGVYKKYDLEFALKDLQSGEQNEFIKLIADLLTFQKEQNPISSIEDFQKKFNDDISKSLLDDTNTRQKRLLSRKNYKPKKVIMSTYAFLRNPDVVAEVLFRSKGFCENCHSQAPFLRSKNGEPYLEVHHKIRLADGGDDSVENAIALCPNCHRNAHFGNLILT